MSDYALPSNPQDLLGRLWELRKNLSDERYKILEGCNPQPVNADETLYVQVVRTMRDRNLNLP